MKLAGSHTFAFPRPVVWAALMDPEVLARTLPGCERLERVGDDRFAGAMQVAVGPVKGQFQGSLALSELQPPERYKMRLDGQGASGFVKGEGAVWLEEVAAGTELHYDLDAEVGGRMAGVGQRLLESSAKAIAKQGLAGLDVQLRARHDAARSVEAAAVAAGEPTPDLAATGGAPGATGQPGEPAARVAGDPALPGMAAAAAPTAAVTHAAPASSPPPSPANAPAAPAAPSTAAFATAVAREVAADLVPPAARRWLLLCVVGLFAFAAILIARSCA
jgi:carbon monoxide dehydrogenase subunit G